MTIGYLRLDADIRILTVTSAAGFTQEVPAAGSLAIVYCTGLTGIDGVQASPGPPYLFELAGVHVTANGKPAPILAIASLTGYQQINIQVPWEGNSPINVSQGSDQASIEIFPPQAWGVFFADSNGYIIAQHAADYSVVTPTNPARPGEWIVAYATNLGAVQFQPGTDQPAQANPLSPVITKSPNLAVAPDVAFALNIVSSPADLPVETNYIGLTPGLVGVYQVNFHVPIAAPAGDNSLYLEKVESCYFPSYCGGFSGGSKLTISVTAKLPVAAH